MAFAAMSCHVRDRDPALKTIEIYDLLTALPRATAHVHSAEYISRADVAVGDEVRPALLLHPAGSVDFPAVQLPGNAVLTFRIGIDQKVWDKPGDGVDFSVFGDPVEQCCRQGLFAVRRPEASSRGSPLD